MRSRLFAAAVLAFTAAIASHAQDSSNLSGKWVLNWKNPAGRDVSASLALRDGAGVYQVRVLGKIEDPCPKVQAPAKVVMEDGVPHLSIQPSQVVGGCRDSLLKLTVGADGSLKGNWRDGREVSFAKE